MADLREEEAKPLGDKNRLPSVMKELELVEAARAGKLDDVRRLIDDGVDVNAKGNLGRTALMESVSREQVAVIQFLVDSGADIDAVDNYGGTALILATLEEKVNLETVRFLLNHGADKHRSGWTELMWAALLGDLADVQALVSSGADINCNGENGSALMKAASSGHLEVVQYLVENGADIHASDRIAWTPLQQAARYGRLDVLHYLIDRGADIQVSDVSGDTALLVSACNGHLHVVRCIVDNGMDITVANDDEETALMMAAWEGHLEIVQFLVDSGADVNAVDSEGNTALSRAKDLGIVRCLLDHGATRHEDWWPEGYTKLMDAAVLGDADIVQDLVSNGADVNEAALDGTTALMFAARNKHIEIVRFLVDNGADVNAQAKSGQTALLQSRNAEVARYLLDHGADANLVLLDGSSALTRASSAGNLRLVCLLVDHGANVNAADDRGWTGLMHAAQEGFSDIARCLIDHGADVNAAMDETTTAVSIAAFHGSLNVMCCLLDANAELRPEDILRAVFYENWNVIRFMLERGVDVNTKDAAGQTMLMEAAGDGQTKLVEYLITHGADVNSTNLKGSSALMYAANSGKLEVVFCLVNHGARIDVSDSQGQTALLCAASSGHTDVVRYLIDAGSDPNALANDGSTALSLASTNGHINVKHLLMQHVVVPVKPKPKSHVVMVNAFTNSASENSPEWLISPLDIEIKQVASISGIGGEFIATWLDSDVVLKMFVPDAYDSTFNDEVRMWHQLRHPNVIKLYGACNIGHHFFVCEYASNGSAVDLLANSAPDLRTPWKYLHHAALGLVYLHERSIVHGNLRGNNILIGNDGLAKLTELSVSKSGKKYKVDFETERAFDEARRWVSPEELAGMPASFASDVYTLGLCMVQLVVGHEPWSHHQWQGALEIFKPIWFPESSSSLKNAPARMQESLRDLMKQVCCHDPQLRVSASACARIFERLADEEANRLHNTEPEPEAITNIHDFQHGELPLAWAKLRDHAENDSGDEGEFGQNQYRIILDDLEEIYTSIEYSSHPHSLFEQVLELIIDISSALDSTSKTSIALQLSSTRATMNIASTFQRRVDAVKQLLGIQTNDKKAIEGEQASITVFDETAQIAEQNDTDTDIQEEKAKQLQIFVSEVENTWVVLEKLETTDERVAFLVCLQAEITNHSNNYSPGQLQIMRKAYDDIKSKTDSSDNSLLTAPVWFVPWYELIVNQWNRVGNGGFGSVYRAKWLDSEVVVKQVDYPGGDSDPTKRDEARRMFMSEVNIWFRLSHPHVVRLFGACHIGAPFFVCEFAPNGALDDYLALHPDEIWQKLREAALGLLYLHECGIIHCDLKCNNVVIGSDGKAKVTDFGLSSIADTTESDTPGAHVSGAWHWVAPEVLMGSAPTRDSDVYSFGMCIVEALRVVDASRHDENTFHNDEAATFPWVVRNHPLPNAAVKAHKKRGKLPSRPMSCTEGQWELIERMCKLEPNERIPISAVVDELEAFAQAGVEKGVCDVVQPVVLEDIVGVISSMHSAIEDKRSADGSETFNVLKMLWTRLADIHRRIAGDETAEHRLGSFVAEAQIKTTTLLSSPQTTLLQMTENALNSYGLHRRLDKLIGGLLLHIPDEGGAGKRIHDWKAVVSTNMMSR